jgi:outer membrane protein TolC
MRASLCVAASVAVVLSLSGCTRNFFRKRADEEVDAVLVEKDKYPAWKIDQFHVYPDPRARFADPTNPDRPPMPPDDPAAYDLSPNPQRPGKAGVAAVKGEGYLHLLSYWDEQNRAEAAEQKKEAAKDKPAGSYGSSSFGQGQGVTRDAETNALVTTSLTAKPAPGERPPYLINLPQSVELGVFNSREYQDAREDVYLTALPVTLQRFAFAAQFFAAGEAVRQWTGSDTVGPEAGHNTWSLNSNVGFSKLFSTGALLLFNFANQTVINLSGPGRFTASQSTINLDLIQPFLQGGGKAVTLEPLTQAERNLVYEIRNYARFRKEFYVAVAGGGGGSITGSAFQPTGVVGNATFQPGQGVTGSSGIVPGVIPGVPITGNPGLQVTPGGSGNVSLQTAIAAPVSGYLTTLLQAAQIRVDIYNIEKLQGFLRLARALQEGGDISQLQTDQFEQQVLNRRSSLLTDQQQYLQALDQFKLQLGLPTNLPLEQDDSDFRPINQQFQRYEDLFNSFKATSDAPLRFASLEAVPRVRGEMLKLFTTSEIVQGTRFAKDIEANWRAWQRLSDDDLRKQLARYGEERRRLLDKKAALESKEQELSPAEASRLDEVEFEIVLGEFERELREYDSRPWARNPDAEGRRRQQQAAYRYVVNNFILVLTRARNERVAQLRNQWPDLRKVCVNGMDLLKADLDDALAAVVQVGLTNRLDLMNVRANVVDAWRQLAVFANALLAPLTVQYSLSSSTPAAANQPFDFNTNRTQQQLILNTQLPLVRKSERNRYRASLIGYQRTRRILQRAEDQVMFDVRSELRLLRQQADLYAIQKRQLELSYMTVENALDTFLAPPAPAAAGGAGVDTATRAASLTTQLINAQTQLYQAQTAMTTIWITYLNTRLQLYRDMELMQLDERGSWIDNVAECLCPPAQQATATAAPRPLANPPAPETIPAPREVPGTKEKPAAPPGK